MCACGQPQQPVRLSEIASQLSGSMQRVSSPSTWQALHTKVLLIHELHLPICKAKCHNCGMHCWEASGAADVRVGMQASLRIAQGHCSMPWRWISNAGARRSMRRHGILCRPPCMRCRGPRRSAMPFLQRMRARAHMLRRSAGAGSPI